MASSMITCPWCGTHYQEFQPNCDNCGGSLPLPAPPEPVEPAELAPEMAAPPPPPRAVPPQVLWRILLIDGWAISGLVFAILGLTFGVTGAALTLTLVAAFVGIPFAGMGLLFLSAGVGLLIWRYQEAHKVVDVLQRGVAVVGEVVRVSQNFQVQVNGRYPWTIEYRYQASGRLFQGKVTTLSQPDLSQQPGRPAYVLHLPDAPGESTLYPSPFGYFGL
jgi:membrane protein implicated in regulation of membrane protease activity